MPRPVGDRNASIEQLKKIVELTQEGLSRPEISDTVGLSEPIVWKYQRRFDLV